VTKKKINKENLGVDGMPLKEPPKPAPLQGWICPACGKGNSPYNITCPCRGYQTNPWVYPLAPHDHWREPYITWRDPQWLYGPTCRAAF
jgi:hypothetical protein